MSLGTIDTLGSFGKGLIRMPPNKVVLPLLLCFLLLRSARSDDGSVPPSPSSDPIAPASPAGQQEENPESHVADSADRKASEGKDFRPYITGTIDDRAALMMRCLEQHPEDFKHSVPVASFLLMKGGKAEGNRILRDVMAPIIAFMKHRLENHQINAGANGFVLLDLLNCYVKTHEAWDQATLDDLRWIVANNRAWKGTTSNLSIVMTMCLFLADHIYGPETLVKPGIPYLQGGPRFGARGDRVVIPFFSKRVEQMARNGSGEFASQPYMIHNVGPLLILDNPYTDKELARKARITYEVCLAHSAATWLRGHWGVSSGRSYPDTLTQGSRGSLGLLWFYFGGIMPGNFTDMGTEQRVIPSSVPFEFAATPFRPSEIIVKAATDREKPYVCRSEFNGPGEFQYSYVNKHYILFSSNLCRWGQTYPYGVMWDEPDQGKISNLWFTVPCQDGPVLGLHTHGINGKAVEFLQERDSLLLVANHLDSIPEHPNGLGNCRYVLGMIPDGEKALINRCSQDGRIFLHYGSVLVALSASQPFEWSRTDDQSKKRGVNVSYYRIPGKNVAMAMETALPEEFPGTTPKEQLEAFAKKITDKTKITIGEEGSNAKGSYTDRGGNVLEKTFGGKALVNGKTPECYDHWPLLDNPWMHQERNGNLVITDGRATRTYDLTNWKITDSGVSATSK